MENTGKVLVFREQVRICYLVGYLQCGAMNVIHYSG
jgi:hypothetical protein